MKRNYSTFQTVYKQFYLNNNDSKDYEKIAVEWKKCFLTVLAKEFKFNKHARKEMFNWGKNGFNWSLLHNDEKLSAEDYREKFMSDAAYCSDRMSLDRLLRCHHLFRCMMYAEWSKKFHLEVENQNEKGTI